MRGDLPGLPSGVYGCFGPMEAPNTAALIPKLETLGMSPDAVQRFFGTFNAAAPEFRAASESVRERERTP
ncbi:NADH ubiquinone oxidoreductase, 20 kDa subunit [mine drainage metagenome]|uniref:NADH ubiquinone oxidoreductase, 20 kDa subunit n=1 Tax=mine drainage metagenome TaxID=410659 RepID=T1AEJ8_9ZZZZ